LRACSRIDVSFFSAKARQSASTNNFQEDFGRTRTDILLQLLLGLLMTLFKLVADLLELLIILDDDLHLGDFLRRVSISNSS